MSSARAQSQHSIVTPISSFVQCQISLLLLPSSVAIFYYSKFCRDNHMSVAESTDRFGIHHRMILRGSYRNLTWAGFEPRTTEFCLDALTDWTNRSWVHLALRANFLQLFDFFYHLLFSARFHFGYFLDQLLHWFIRSFAVVITWM